MRGVFNAGDVCEAHQAHETHEAQHLLKVARKAWWGGSASTGRLGPAPSARGVRCSACQTARGPVGAQAHQLWAGNELEWSA